MQKEIIAAIAACLNKQEVARQKWNGNIVKIPVEWPEGIDINGLATEIAAAIAPLMEAGVNKNIEEAKAIVVKVAASLVRSQACEYAEDLNLPKTTPITAIRKFEHEARVWNDTNRLRAIELKRAYDLMK